MTEEQKQALLNALDYLWAYGADKHPAPARALNALREALGMEKKKYAS